METILTKPEEVNGEYKPPVKEDEVPKIKAIPNFRAFGCQQAGISGASIQVLRDNITWLYFNRVTENNSLEEKEALRKTELNKKIHDLEAEQQSLDVVIGQVKSKIEDAEKEISELKQTGEKIKGGDMALLKLEKRPDHLGYYISVIVLSVLTCYLFLFYTSAVYNSFLYDVTVAGSRALSLATTIFNPHALAEAYRKSGFTALFVLSAPVIFLGLGFLIHKFISEKRKLRITGVLSFTFSFDVIMGYSIVGNIYEVKYQSGVGGYTEAWNFKLIFQQVDFYIILFAGFVTYIVWGLILNYVIEGYQDRNPMVVALKSLRIKIGYIKAKLTEYKREFAELQSKRLDVESGIKKIKEELYVKYFDKHLFEERVAEFMSGWHAYIYVAYPQERELKHFSADGHKNEQIQKLYADNIQSGISDSGTTVL